MPAVVPPMKTLPEIPSLPGKTAQRGGVLKVHLEAEPPHLNPLDDTVQVIDRVVGGLVFETLLDCIGDRYQPNLADSWDLSPDGLRLTMHLKAGVRWQDDKVFSGLDVQATLEHLMRSTTRSELLHAMIADLEGVDVKEWTAILAAAPPMTTEALPLPWGAARRWLARAQGSAAVADVSPRSSPSRQAPRLRRE